MGEWAVSLKSDYNTLIFDNILQPQGVNIQELKKNSPKYFAALQITLTALEEKGWSEKGLKAYVKTVGTLADNSFALGDLASDESLAQIANGAFILVTQPQALSLSKGKEGYEGKYWLNGQYSYLFTSLASYIPNFSVSKSATNNEELQVTSIKEDEVVAPGESSFVNAIGGLTALSDVEKVGTLSELTAGTDTSASELLGTITDSPEFINTLKDTTFTGNSNFMYNFVSDAKGSEAAKEAFDSMNLSDIKTVRAGTPEETTYGKLPNGDTVNLHASSSKEIKGAPSLEIQDSASNGKFKIKIRY